MISADRSTKVDADCSGTDARSEVLAGGACAAEERCGVGIASVRVTCFGAAIDCELASKLFDELDVSAHADDVAAAIVIALPCGARADGSASDELDEDAAWLGATLYWLLCSLHEVSDDDRCATAAMRPVERSASLAK